MKAFLKCALISFTSRATAKSHLDFLSIKVNALPMRLARSDPSPEMPERKDAIFFLSSSRSLTMI